MISVFPLLGNIYLKLVRTVIISVTCLYRSEKRQGHATVISKLEDILC